MTELKFYKKKNRPPDIGKSDIRRPVLLILERVRHEDYSSVLRRSFKEEN